VKNADPYATKFQQTVRKCICRTCNKKKQKQLTMEMALTEHHRCKC